MFAVLFWQHVFLIEKEIRQPYLHEDEKELLKEESVKNGQTLVLEAWGVRIVVETEAWMQ